MGSQRNPPSKFLRVGSATASLETRATKKRQPAGRLHPSLQLQHMAGSWDGMGSSPSGNGLHSSPTTLGCITHPFHLFSPYFIKEGIFLKISLLTSKPGSLGNKGGRDGSRRSVPILGISNVALNIFIFILLIKDMPRCKAEQGSPQSIYCSIISHLQQTWPHQCHRDEKWLIRSCWTENSLFGEK